MQLQFSFFFFLNKYRRQNESLNTVIEHSMGSLVDYVKGNKKGDF